jgi:hypothetical protein
MCAIGVVTGEPRRAQKGEDFSKGRVAGDTLGILNHLWRIASTTLNPGGVPSEMKPSEIGASCLAKINLADPKAAHVPQTRF